MQCDALPVLSSLCIEMYATTQQLTNHNRCHFHIHVTPTATPTYLRALLNSLLACSWCCCIKCLLTLRGQCATQPPFQCTAAAPPTPPPPSPSPHPTLGIHACEAYACGASHRASAHRAPSPHPARLQLILPPPSNTARRNRYVPSRLAELPWYVHECSCIQRLFTLRGQRVQQVIHCRQNARNEAGPRDKGTVYNSVFHRQPGTTANREHPEMPQQGGPALCTCCFKHMLLLT